MVNGDHWRKSQTDEMHSSVDHEEPSLHGYIGITAPKSMTQENLQKICSETVSPKDSYIKKTRKMAISIDVLMWERKTLQAVTTRQRTTSSY